jgi:CDP-glycerol glycerophosphotransferase (TagB/SpsB family)
MINRNTKYIKQEEILECLKISDLVVTDFSSIIFDAIVRNKPYIVYIPDSEDHELIKKYKTSYYDIINGLKNRTIYFENIFFNINETIKKILYYIKNNFLLGENLKLFYKSFNFKGRNNTININIL